MKQIEYDFLKTINDEMVDFRSKRVQIVPSLTFNQEETIQAIYFYYNSQFLSGNIDSDGDRKYFYNVVRNPCKVFTKAIDFDTKNIRLLTTELGDPLKTWFLERDMKFWMRDKQFGKVLNRIFRELPIFGSVVLKIVDGYPYFVDLRNFIVQQSADSLIDSNYIIEIHDYTVPEFRRVAKDMKWPEDKVNETIKLFRSHKKRKDARIRVYERYGEVEESKDDGNSDFSFRRVFWADVGEDSYDSYENLLETHKGVQLGSDEWKDLPYWEFHKDKISGRWLGVGIVEELFEPQIKQNEIANLQSKSAAWKAMVVFQTRDQAFNRNLKTSVQNGEVLNTDSEITQVNVQDNNLAFFNEETQKWMRNRDELSFAYDPIQGERSPAGTPLGSTQLSVGQTLSYFEGIQEEIAMDIKEMLYKSIIPQFMKENNQEHTLRLVGQDLEQFIGMIKNEMILKEVIRQSLKGKLPTAEEKDVIAVAIEESLKKDKERLLTIPKDYYKNAKYDIDIDITGESIDTRVRSATYFAILQAITVDPMALKDPQKKKILSKIAEDGGVNPNDLFEMEQTPLQMMEEQMGANRPNRAAGGGVSVPSALNMNNLAGATQATV